MSTLDPARVADRRPHPPTHLLKVRDVIRETADSVSLVFDVSAEQDTSFHYKPGQFLTLKIPSTRTGSVSRCYSLSSSPHSDPYPTVTVKCTDAGYASNWLFDNAVAGMTIESLAPRGTFVPRTWDADFVLLAAGSGITPMMSIIKTALAEHSNMITLVYANRDPESTIFADELADIERRYPRRLTVRRWFESEAGLPTAKGLGEMIDGLEGRDAFLCGPAPFMQLAEKSLLDARIAGERIHREVFRSLDSNPFDDTTEKEAAPTSGDEGFAAVTVEINGTQHSFAWPRSTLLLDVLLDMGIDTPYSCREGSCGGCAYSLTDGQVQMHANDTLDGYELERGVRLACQSVPVSDNVAIVFDQ